MKQSSAISLDTIPLYLRYNDLAHILRDIFLYIYETHMYAPACFHHLIIYFGVLFMPTCNTNLFLHYDYVIFIIQICGNLFSHSPIDDNSS